MRSVPSSPSLPLHNLQTTGTTGYNQFIRLSRQLERLTTPNRLNLALISSALDDLIELKVSLNTHRRQSHPVSILNDIHDFEKRFYIHLIAQLSHYTSDSNLPDANDVIRLAKLFDTCASFLMTDSESLSNIESVDTYLQSFHSITTQLCSKNMLIFLEHSISKSNILSSLLHMTILIQPYYSESKSSNFLDFQNLSCIGTRLWWLLFWNSKYRNILK